MAQKKIRIGEKRRAEIKAKFERINPAKLTDGERLYYNKVKAGKKRQATAFKTKSGQFAVVPDKIVDTYVRPLLKSKNPLYTDADLKRHIKDNLKALKDIAQNDDIGAFYQAKNIENALRNTNDLTKFYINDGNGRRKFSKDEMLEFLKQYESQIFELGGFGFYTKVNFRKGFSEMEIYLPDLEGVEDLDELAEDDEFRALMSDPKNKRKRTREQKDRHNQLNKKYRDERRAAKNKNR